jgi:hypothetical protein
MTRQLNKTNAGRNPIGIEAEGNRRMANESKPSEEIVEKRNHTDKRSNYPEKRRRTY